MTNPTAFTPEELANRLDDLLANPQQPVDDPLLQAASRLIQVRPPLLSPTAFERIRQQLMDAAAQPPSLKTRILQSPVLLAALIVFVLVLVILVSLLILGVLQNQDDAAAISTPVITETIIVSLENQAVISTATHESAANTPESSAIPLPTITPIPATITPIVPTATDTQLSVTTTAAHTPQVPTITPSWTATLLPATDRPMPAATATSLPAADTIRLSTATMINTSAAAPTEESPLPEMMSTVIPLPPTVFSPSATPLPPTASITPTLTRTAAPLTVLVIEGEIEAINLNQIVIFGIPILLDPNSPLLTSLRVGDELRIEAVMVTSGSVVIVSAVTFEFTSDTIFVNETTGELYRDTSTDGDCSNPPPAWAPANGWRARCENQPAPGNAGNNPGNSGNAPGNSGGMGSSGGMGMGDDGSGS